MFLNGGAQNGLNGGAVVAAASTRVGGFLDFPGGICQI
jgi:hypothetical protein